MVINKISKELICTIRLENNYWKFYDCDGKELPVPSSKRIFSSSMKKHYLKKRENKKMIFRQFGFWLEFWIMVKRYVSKWEGQKI